jgi:transposase
MRRYDSKLVEGTDIFVGVDVHQRQWHVTIRTEEVELFTGSIPSAWSALRRLLERFRPERTSVVYEAGYFGYHLYDALCHWGARAVVTPPSLVPMEYGNRVKTDKRDSRKLALLLSRGLLRSNWVPDEQLRCHRQVLRQRRQLLADRVRLQSRIKALLSFFGIEMGIRGGRWSHQGIAALRTIALPDEWAQASYLPLLDGYAHVREQVAAHTRLLRRLSQQPRYRESYHLLVGIPGIGFLTAMAILLELGEMARFQRADALSAYVGLTPAQYSSGERVRLGRITRVGQNYLRGLLIEAAWGVITYDAEWRQVYSRTAHHAGRKRAIVAVARRLLLRCRRVVLDRRPYVIRTAA